jgi:uncharacterized membrane protein YkoI
MKTAQLRRKRVILPAIAAVAALSVGGVVWSSTASADLQGSERERVATAATEAVGGGTVVDAEASDDRGEAYEVEVRKDDGTEVDVTLDKQLEVVSQDADDRTDGPDADDATDDSTDDRTDDGTGQPDADDRTDGPDPDDRALSASERASAERAALRAVDGGTVTGVEAGDDRGEAYEVQVRKGSTEWDVELDADFKLLRKMADN